ncbi:MAG TPA: vitamin K epoxide reductase family protein [Aridibacter sp.]|nr:vitamin K epoxide reductase family protein [Aridibacter sp.]
MDETANDANSGGRLRAAFPVAACVASLAGLADSAYLTAKHYSGNEVPCSLITGCEKVLTSSYAEIFGVPTALYGALAYFAAFSLALLVFYGNQRLWNIFGALVSVMAVFTLWLIYLQAFVIEAFCQFCLLSALTTLTLLAIFIASRFFPKS